MGLDHFGASAPAETIFENFGFTGQQRVPARQGPRLNGQPHAPGRPSLERLAKARAPVAPAPRGPATRLPVPAARRGRLPWLHQRAVVGMSQSGE